MIYDISQVSNRDLQLLYTYRILRHPSALLNAIYRYDSPETYAIEKPQAVRIENTDYFEYHIQLEKPMTKIPFLEFDCDNEMNLKHIEDFVEVEVTSSELIIRSTADNLTEPIEVTIYWVLSMKQIRDILSQIAKKLKDDKSRLEAADKNIDKIKFSEKPVINPDSLVPNLVKIGTDSMGLIYDDSLFRLTGALAEQRLINSSQDIISRLLKVHNGVVSFTNQQKESRIYQGFSGGVIKIDGTFKNLVLRDIDSAVLLNNISADFVLIDNCQAVLFRKNADGDAGYSRTVEKMRVRTSNVTIQQQITIKQLWLWSRALLIQDKGTIQAVRFVDASCTLCHRAGNIDSFAPSAVQGIYQDLHEMWTKQRQLTYVGGQAENQVPLKQVKVTVIVKGGSNPNPSPNPGGKIYSPYKDWYWSGDSRTIGLVGVIGCAGKGYGGQGLTQLKQVTNEIVSGGNQKNIMLWWGVNGLEDGYAAVYEQIAQSAGSNSVIFVGTVGRVFNTRGVSDSEDTIGQEGGGGSTTIEAFNANIETFNTNLKSALSGYSDIHVLDIWDYIENTLMKDHTQLELSAGVGNGLHYSSMCYQKIYDWVCSQITNQKLGEWADFASNGEKDIMTIYDGLRQSGFSKNGAIGALANMSHESGWITHLISYNSTYFIDYGMRAEEDLLDYMNSATSRIDLYNKIQATYNGYSSDVLVGYGLTQFTSQENLGNLFDYHTSTGLAYDRLGVQIPAFIKVLQDNNYWDDTNSSATPGDAAYYLCIHYERPRDMYTAAANRRVEADNLAAKYDFYD